MPKFFIKTYGCQMNERDSEQVAHSLHRSWLRTRQLARRRPTSFCSTPAACATWPSKRRSAKWECSAAWRKSRPEMVFGFLGCMAQARGAELLSGIPHVDLVVGTQKFHRVADYVDELVARKAGQGRRDRSRCDGRSAFFHRRHRKKKSARRKPFAITSLAPQQATAFVSIMQGCNMHCTFCIVPQTRGAERSRTIAEIVSEVRELVARGRERSDATRPNREPLWPARVSRRRSRADKSPFVQLLEAVHAIDGLERFRFTSPHPIGFRDDLIDALSRSAETRRARASAAAIRLESHSESDAPYLHGGEIRAAGRANSRSPDQASRSRPISSSAFPARPIPITKQPAISLNSCNSIMLSSFVIRRGARRPPPGCPIRSTSP